jgi:hypothetical protein
MGTDLLVIFENRLSDDEFFALPETLNHRVAALGEDFQEFLGDPWYWTPDGMDGKTRITSRSAWSPQTSYIGGPKNLWPEHHFLQMFGTRWRWFLQEPEWTRKLCRVIAGALKTNRCLYIPDENACCSIAHEWVENESELTFDEVLHRLNERCGPPAVTLSDISSEPIPHRPNGWDYSGYFVDTF